MKTQKGFTLLEVLLVIGLFAILATTSLALYANFLPATDLSESLFVLKQQVRKARELSVGGFNNASHGVYVDGVNKRIVIYQGDSYAARLESADLETKFSSSMTLADSFEQDQVNFAKWSGLPSASGEIFLSQPSVGQGAVTVNALGVVSSD